MGLLDSLVSTNSGGLLGQSFDDPRSAAIMALSAGLLQKNLAGGLIGANNAYAQAKQAATQAEFQKMQMDNMREELALKKLQASRKDEGMAMLQRLLGGGSAPDYKPGQLGSGSFGAAPNADPMAPPVRRPGGLANATPEQIAMAKVYGYDLTEPWKVANQGFEFKPNSFRLDPNTKAREYIPDVKEGVQYQNGVASNIPGYLEMQTQRTLATEGPKALLQSAGRLNLRPGADGKQYPVPELSENPALQQLLNGVLDGPARGPMPQGAAPIRPEPRLPQPEAGVNGKFVGNPDDVAVAIANIKDPQERANAQAALESQLRSNGGVLRNAAPTPSQGYGKTTEQQIAEEVDKEKRLAQVKADVTTTDAKRQALDAARYMDELLTMAKNHPGKAKATGLASLNPLNAVPGSDAKNFNVLMDQIRGQSFMQAFQSLKGAGAITEQEGKAATAAVARLNQAQSTQEFESALNEYQGIIRKGEKRMREATQNQGGATGDFSPKPPTGQAFDAMPPANPSNKGKSLTDTQTGKKYVSNGFTWVEQK